MKITYELKECHQHEDGKIKYVNHDIFYTMGNIVYYVLQRGSEKPKIYQCIVNSFIFTNMMNYKLCCGWREFVVSNCDIGTIVFDSEDKALEKAEKVMATRKIKVVKKY